MTAGAPRDPLRLRGGAIVKILISLVLAGLLLGLLVHSTELTREELLSRTFRPSFLLLAFAAYLFVAFTRALRFRALHRELPAATMSGWVQVATVHAALNQILPLRTGEASYIYLMRRAHGCTVGRSLLVLLVSRIFDLLLVFLYCLLFLPVVKDDLGVGLGLAVAVSAAVVAGCILTLALLRPALRVSYRIMARRFPAGSVPATLFAGRVRDRIARLVAEAEMFQDARHFFAIFALSGAMWTGLFVTFFGLLNGFGFPITLPSTIVGSIGAVLTNVLPVNGFANVGTLEAGWTLGLMLVGFENSQALAAALWAHLGFLTLALTLGLAGYVWMAKPVRVSVPRG